MTNRAWTDSNANYAVDCNLLSAAAQNTAAAGGDVCGALVGANLNFGNLNPNVATVDPEILHGWGIRPYNWRFGASVQQQLLPGVALEASYNRRHWGNFLVTYNRLVGPEDYDTWVVPVPDHPDLPNAGSTASFVAITPAAAARGVQDFQTTEKNVAGEDRTAYWHGVDLNVTARLARDLTVQAGTTTGRGVRDTCALWRARPQFSITGTTANRLDACDVTEPWLTTVRGLASYRIPKVDVLASTTIRSTRTVASENASNGASLSANYQMPNTVVQQLLGRLPAGAFATGNTTVNLLAPSELYPLDRRTEVDIRIAKISIRGHSARRRRGRLQPVRRPYHDDLSSDLLVFEQRGDVARSDGDSRTAARPVECDPDVLSYGFIIHFGRYTCPSACATRPGQGWGRVRSWPKRDRRTRPTGIAATTRSDAGPR